MSSRNPIGTISLATATCGFALLETARHLHVIGSGHVWSIMQAGFETGMVGGLADWFAVSALFRPIPSKRFKIPHTNLLVENRAVLSAGIVDMVQNRWLSPATLAEHLGRFSASRFLFEHLSQPSTRAQLLGAVRDLLMRLAGSLDAPEIVGFLDRALRDQLAELEMGPAFGRWLEARILAGDTAYLWDLLADTLTRSANQGGFKAPIRKMLETAVDNYKDRGFWEKVKAKVGEFFFDYDQLSADISSALADGLREIKEDGHHPLRGKLDEHLLSFSRKIAHGDPETIAALGHFKRHLAESAELEHVLARILSRLQDTLKTQLADPEAHLSRLLDHLLENLIAELRIEPESQTRLDEWVRQTILDLSIRHHHIIGEMVKSSLEKLSDSQLVAQIEEKVGGDLQYIRLNGAVIGSLVGMVLAGIKLLLG